MQVDLDKTYAEGLQLLKQSQNYYLPRSQCWTVY